MKAEKAPSPFLKWAGGKQALADQILPLVPSSLQRWIEPFVGGGSLFFRLAPKAAILNDRNAWLMETYQAVRQDWREVARKLDRFINTEEEYLRIRAIDPKTLDPLTSAAHFIYLNKTCFRGLYRVNQKGHFNVPYGRYVRRSYDPLILEASARALADAELLSKDFAEVLDSATPADFVYLDPPYYPTSPTSDFDRYTPWKFGDQDHVRLASACRTLCKRGVPFLLSNSDVPRVRGLYEGFRIQALDVRREINLKAGRRSLTELLIAPPLPPETK